MDMDVRMISLDSRPIHVFWDTENAQVPHGFDKSLIVPIIIHLLGWLGFCGPVTIDAVVGDISDASRIPPEVHQSLGHQMNFIDMGSSDSDAADKEIKTRMLNFFNSERTGLVVLIAGDGGYNSFLNDIQRSPFFHTILLYPRGRTRKNLLNSHYGRTYEWERVLAYGATVVGDDGDGDDGDGDEGDGDAGAGGAGTGGAGAGGAGAGGAGAGGAGAGGAGAAARGRQGAGAAARGRQGAGAAARGRQGAGAAARGRQGAGASARGRQGAGASARGRQGAGAAARGRQGAGAAARGRQGAGAGTRGRLGAGAAARGRQG